MADINRACSGADVRVHEMAGGLGDGSADTLKSTLLPCRRSAGVFILDDRGAVRMGGAYQQTGNAARLARRFAQPVEGRFAEAPAEIDSNDGQTLAARFEHQHSRIQRIERAFGRGQTILKSPHHFVSGGRDIGFGNTGAQSRPGRERDRGQQQCAGQSKHA